jgi:prophage DNA circulation protein
MSVLQDQLRPASWRGLTFPVEDAGVTVGRRVQVHEYPKRDKPFVDGLRTVPVTAVIVGLDYIERVNRLLAEAEKPGAGTLVHPWLGTMQVTLSEPVRAQFSSKGLGRAVVDFVFVEAGELVFPVAQPATQQAAREQADKLSAASQADFAESFKTDGAADFVGQDALAKLGEVGDAVSAGLSAVLPGLQQLAGLQAQVTRWQALIDNPAALAAAVAGTLGLSGVFGLASDVSGLVRGLLAFVAGFRDDDGPVVQSPGRAQAHANSIAITGLVRRVVLAQAVGASASYPADVYDDAVSLRDQLLAAIDAEALLAGDAAYRALLASRAAVWRDLTDRSQGSARLRTVRPLVPVPALALAYDLYEDAGRDAEITARNRVRHPGFVPASDIRVLST